MERGITVRPNFQGCLENVLYISPSTRSIFDMLQNLQKQLPFYGLEQGMVGSGALCEVSHGFNHLSHRIYSLYANRTTDKSEENISFVNNAVLCDIYFYFYA